MPYNSYTSEDTFEDQIDDAVDSHLMSYEEYYNYDKYYGYDPPKHRNTRTRGLNKSNTKTPQTITHSSTIDTLSLTHNSCDRSNHRSSTSNLTDGLYVALKQLLHAPEYLFISNITLYLKDFSYRLDLNGHISVTKDIITSKASKATPTYTTPLCNITAISFTSVDRLKPQTPTVLTSNISDAFTGSLDYCGINMKDITPYSYSTGTFHLAVEESTSLLLVNPKNTFLPVEEVLAIGLDTVWISTGGIYYVIPIDQIITCMNS